MGWKNVKEHYRIDHIVQVTDEGICIGSGYLPNLIVINPNGKIVKADVSGNEKLSRYFHDMDEDLERLKALIQTPDSFSESIPVYTYDGGEIIEKRCEAPGYPNVTHDGLLMYENTFSTDRARVVTWAKECAAIGIRVAKREIADQQKRLDYLQRELAVAQRDLSKLENDYPSS